MRAQVATFAGCPMPSQFGSRQAPKKIFKATRASVVPLESLIRLTTCIILHVPYKIYMYLLDVRLNYPLIMGRY
jgi:hypothetical protein